MCSLDWQWNPAKFHKIYYCQAQSRGLTAHIVITAYLQHHGIQCFIVGGKFHHDILNRTQKFYSTIIQLCYSQTPSELICWEFNTPTPYCHHDISYSITIITVTQAIPLISSKGTRWPRLYSIIWRDGINFNQMEALVVMMGMNSQKKEC